jgi:hypothetical protein
VVSNSEDQEALSGKAMRSTSGINQGVSAHDQNVARGSVVSLASSTQGDADVRLVQALRRDDPGALEVLVEHYGDRAYRLAMRITGVRQDAEAATEDALQTAARDVDSIAIRTRTLVLDLSAHGPRRVRGAARASAGKGRDRDGRSPVPPRRRRPFRLRG